MNYKTSIIICSLLALLSPHNLAAQNAVNHRVHFGGMAYTSTHPAEDERARKCTKAEILSHPYLVSDEGCKIVGFEFSFMPEEPNPVFVKGDTLPRKLIKQVKLFGQGTQIFIEVIKLECNGKRTEGNSFVLIIEK
jgi:hypothetical protein